MLLLVGSISFQLTLQGVHRFTVTELKGMYVVSRLVKETYTVPLHGKERHHSVHPDFSVTVPKNGLSSPAAVSFQVYFLHLVISTYNSTVLLYSCCQENITWKCYKIILIFWLALSLKLI